VSFGVRRRARKADQFVQIDNAFLRDEALSIEARGLGAYLLTHSEGFRVSAAALGKACGTGRDKTRRLIQELEDAGYLVREHSREAGRFATDEFSMSDEKAQVEASDGISVTGDQSPEIAPHKKTNSKNTIENTTPPGGDDFAAAPDGGMFAAPEQPKAEPVFSAGTVVAAYVDSYRAKTGGDPTKRYIAQVGREAKALITDGRDHATILAAAVALGKTAFPTLERQFALAQHGGQASPVRRSMPGPGVVHTREEIEAQREWLAQQPAATPISAEELAEFWGEELGEVRD
jgi:hypothetical protein